MKHEIIDANYKEIGSQSGSIHNLLVVLASSAIVIAVGVVVVGVIIM